jgi:hypothetical protein
MMMNNNTLIGVIIGAGLAIMSYLMVDKKHSFATKTHKSHPSHLKAHQHAVEREANDTSSRTIKNPNSRFPIKGNIFHIQSDSGKRETNANDSEFIQSGTASFVNDPSPLKVKHNPKKQFVITQGDISKFASRSNPLSSVPLST